MNRKIKVRRGSSIVSTIVLLVVLFVLAMASITIFTSENILSIRSRKASQAYYIALAGVDSLAEYIVKSQEEMTFSDLEANIDAMEEFSDPVYLGDREYFQVRVERGENYIDIIGVGTITGIPEISKEVSLRMIRNEGFSSVFEHALYVKGALNIGKVDLGENNHKNTLKEGTTIGILADTVLNKEAEKLDKEITLFEMEEMTFNIPDFPEFPSLSTEGWEESSATTSSALVNKTYYTNGLSLGSMTIDEVMEVRVKNLTINTGNNGKISIGENGKLTIYVDGSVTIETNSTSNMEEGSKADNLSIYSKGELLTIRNNTETKANIYMNNAKTLNLDNGMYYEGIIIAINEDANVRPNIELGNNSAPTNFLLFSPNGKINLKNNSEVNGVIIGEEINIGNNASVGFAVPESTDFIGIENSYSSESLYTKYFYR